jgi:protein-S-isoprenylcysteine O-methyltransferase Ste14
MLKVVFGLVFFGLLGAVRGVARQLRKRPEGKVYQMPNEVSALRVIRPTLGLIFYLALFDWLLPGTRLPWAQLGTPLLVRWSGAGLCVLSVAIIWSSFAALGHNYRGGVGLWGDHELVTKGPYARVRHPIYGAFMLLMLGAGAMSTSWLVGTSGLLLTLSIPAFRLRIEERELKERFGSKYLEYERSTPRFLPRVL